MDRRFNCPPPPYLLRPIPCNPPLIPSAARIHVALVQGAVACIRSYMNPQMLEVIPPHERIIPSGIETFSNNKIEDSVSVVVLVLPSQPCDCTVAGGIYQQSLCVRRSPTYTLAPMPFC